MCAERAIAWMMLGGEAEGQTEQCFGSWVGGTEKMYQLRCSVETWRGRREGCQHWRRVKLGSVRALICWGGGSPWRGWWEDTVRAAWARKISESWGMNGSCAHQRFEILGVWLTGNGSKFVDPFWKSDSERKGKERHRIIVTDSDFYSPNLQKSWYYFLLSISGRGYVFSLSDQDQAQAYEHVTNA